MTTTESSDITAVLAELLQFVETLLRNVLGRSRYLDDSKQRKLRTSACR
jgi:hypothetical protein